jgi:16S rRNA (cytidine1402-2'-O)-methyltransferase
MRAKSAPINTPQVSTAPLHTFSVDGCILAAPKVAAGLFLVATPIGHLGDVTLRALQTLAGVDLIACEDTRVTRRLTERYAISTQLTPYHEHNAEAARPRILKVLGEGGSVALVSDAGTPLISDPGFKLVREACAAAFAVTALPGPSSVLTALSLAALPTDRFFFEGFLPPKRAARRTRLRELASIDATLVLFESGNRVGEALTDLAEVMGGRGAAICRELTKIHEEIVRGPLVELSERSGQLETRGEFVLVIAPPAAEAGAMTQDALDALLRDELTRSSVKDAVAHAVELSGRPRREIYARALELAKETSRTSRQMAAEGDDGQR